LYAIVYTISTGRSYAVLARIVHRAVRIDSDGGTHVDA
jgi:hypothetical protein